MKVCEKNESNKSPHRIDFVPDAFEKFKNNLPTFVSNANPDFHVSFITRMQKSVEKIMWNIQKVAHSFDYR